MTERRCTGRLSPFFEANDYKDVLARLFKEIDYWQILECPRPQLKQGESQTPKAVSE